jgi:hypothetical protein
MRQPLATPPSFPVVSASHPRRRQRVSGQCVFTTLRRCGGVLHRGGTPSAELTFHGGALVISTPLYHGAYGGLLKSFLDVLPPLGLTGKVVLPLSTGARAPAVESTLRPVLVALGARRVVSGLSVPALENNLEPQLRSALDEFAETVRRGRRGVIDETDSLPSTALAAAGHR